MLEVHEKNAMESTGLLFKGHMGCFDLNSQGIFCTFCIVCVSFNHQNSSGIKYFYSGNGNRKSAWPMEQAWNPG